MAKVAAQPVFQSILDTPSNKIDRAFKQPPAGTYLVLVLGQPRYDISSKKQTKFVEFVFKFLEAVEVDEDALEAYLTNPDGSKKSLQDCSIKAQYYYETDHLKMLLSLLDHLDGIKPGDQEAIDAVDASIQQLISESPGKQCIISVRHEARQAGDGINARVGATAPAGE